MVTGLAADQVLLFWSWKPLTQCNLLLTQVPNSASGWAASVLKVLSSTAVFFLLGRSLHRALFEFVLQPLRKMLYRSCYYCSNSDVSSSLLFHSRSDGGVYCHSYDEGFPHGFILVRAHTHYTSPPSHTHYYHHYYYYYSLIHCPLLTPFFLFSHVQALCADHPQTPVLPEEMQDQITLHLEGAVVR